MISMALSSFISLYLTPLITNAVGIDAYGFVSLAKTITSYANIFLIAINAFSARYIAFEYTKEDKHTFKVYFSTVFWGNAIVGGVLLTTGFLCVWRLEFLLNVPEKLLKEVKTLFVFVFIAFYLSTLSGVFSVTGYIKDKLDRVHLVKVISYAAEIVLLALFFLVLYPRLWYVGLTTFATAIVVLLGNCLLTRKYLPEAAVGTTLFSGSALKLLLTKGIWGSINTLGNVLNSGLDQLIANLMIGPVGMGQVAVAKNINVLINGIYAAIAQAFQPRLLNDYLMGDKNSFLEDMRTAMKCSGMITNVIFAGFFALGHEFLRLWMPEQNTSLLYYLTILTLLPSVADGSVYPLFYIVTLTVKTVFPCIVTILGGVLNVVGMYLLIKYTRTGIYSIPITTAIIMGVIDLVINPVYLAHCMDLKWPVFYSSLAKNFLSCGLVIFVFVAIKRFVPEIHNWGTFFVQMMTFGVIGLFLQTVILFRPKYIVHLIQRSISKLRK